MIRSASLPLSFEKEINAGINAQNSTNPENAEILIGNRFVVIDAYHDELSLINEEIKFKKELRDNLHRKYMKLVSLNETEEKNYRLTDILRRLRNPDDEEDDIPDILLTL